MSSSASCRRQRPALGRSAAEGVALTPGRSLAVDAAYHKLGLPVFVAAPELTDETGSPSGD